MKQLFKKKQKVVKGTSSAVLISLLVHAGLFLIAGLLVVFTVIDKPEPKFEPPPAVERPKMKLKKPKVQVKKNSKPKATAKIVTKVNRANMPDIQLPEMSGIGDGLAGGMGGGFDMLPEISEVTMFGSDQAIGNDFVGTFIDFKRDRAGNSIGMDTGTFLNKLARFTNGGWKESRLARYYQSPKKLYATSFMVPTVPSSSAPAAFGEPECGGWCWAVLYKGQLVHQEGIKFRFRGQGDDIMLVRVNGELVLNGSWPGDTSNILAPRWTSSAVGNRNFRLGNNYAVVGDWITLEPGIPQPMEVMIGEVPGGHFDCLLVVEVEGEEYEMNKYGGPIFPMFTTTEPSHDLLDAIIPYLVPGEAGLTNGPIFRDY